MTDEMVGIGLLWLYWAVLATGIVPGLILNAVATRRAPTTQPYKLGYTLGCGAIHLAVLFVGMLLFTDRQPHTPLQLTGLGVGSLAVLWLGWKVVRRSKIAFIVVACGTLNPILWIVAPKYVRTRWLPAEGYPDPLFQSSARQFIEGLSGWWRLWSIASIAWVVFHLFPLPDSHIYPEERGSLYMRVIWEHSYPGMSTSDLQKLRAALITMDTQRRDEILGRSERSVWDSLQRGLLPEVQRRYEHNTRLLERQVFAQGLVERLPLLLLFPVGSVGLVFVGRWVHGGFRQSG